MTNINLYDAGTGREIFGVIPVATADKGAGTDIAQRRVHAGNPTG